MNTNRSERGQAIVLIVIAVVAMFGFVGLAVDGGRVYSEQRRAQNAADAAAYAAAMASVEGSDPYEAALAQAALNDYSDEDENTNTDAQVDVIVNHPPTRGPYAGDDEYYEVIVRTDVVGSFSRVISIDQLPVEAYAVVHATGGSNGIDDDNVIHGLDDDGTAIEFKGNVNVQVDGGNIMANGEISKKGASGDIIVKGGGIHYVDGNTDGWKGNVSPAPKKVSSPAYPASVPEPDCGIVYREDSTTKNGKRHFSPGIYNSYIKINAKDNVVFEPGLYCLKDGIKINGSATVMGKDVTFILQGGDLGFNGNSNIRLTRPNDLIDASGNQWGGMLVYVPPSNSDAIIDLTGTNGTVFAGTVFAPEGWCRIGGTADMLGLKANVVCFHVLFHGTPTVYINYKPAQNYRMPPVLELSQ